MAEKTSNLAQRPKNLDEMIEFFKFKYETDSANELRNSLLVVAALFITLAFQAIINLPSHVFPGDQHRANIVIQVMYLVGTNCLLFASLTVMEFLTSGMPFKREMYVVFFSLGVTNGCSLFSTQLSIITKWVICGIPYLVLCLRWIPKLLKKSEKQNLGLS